MKRALLSILGAGVLLAGLAHASTTEPAPSPSRSEDASSLAVCVSAKPATEPAGEQAPACRAYYCVTCEDNFDICMDSCTTQSCYDTCLSRYRLCASCCIETPF
ncbi:hypothetical protein HPC49_26900 [Pyxidicoccus fallax]|uniref:Uncharacterized protein n=1 Tax=Pyxidicoccus fallax TaxID=394095 RepID=A0A848LAG2_9BACT|nr:hypothetical protein [Pyxidicoccus fallax]NMO15879.1 hypothetical protein [Pyxidicoccus fallax]NPC81834.1 hypothetical protein [Pyxidicoccus fallax]